MPTDRRWSLAVLGAAMLLGGCTGTSSAPDQASPAAPASTAAAQPPAPPSTAPPVPNTLQASFQELSDTLPATIGVAYVPVGGTQLSTLGKWTSGVAWSTMKVPLVIAALRADHATAESLAAKAITQSDNEAAEQLWSQLGSPDQAAQQVQAVLRETGDQATVVQSKRVRPPFTAFGQTQWTLALEAQFAAHLPCRTDSGEVLGWMSHLSAGNWGLANDGAPSKGGWGPGESGGYLVRQFAIMSVDTGKVGVAIAADASSFDAGVAALNQIAQWLAAHKSDLPAGHCPG